eukprot:m.25608 g.25608  ORF g.25608 m.25608 type:complete len:288 (-) comp9197_c0_seq1:135-998(-)
MARNEEKAMSLLARWLRVKKEENAVAKPQQHEIETLYDAEQFRIGLIKDVSKKIASIQNAGLGEYRLRDLNDEINKLMRSKRYWEHKIIEMGGPNYLKRGARMAQQEGVMAPGRGGYRYYGAAKDLPGVRELFADAPTKAPKKTRAELFKFVDADYYGYRDEEDGILLTVEADAEQKNIDAATEEWKKRMETRSEDEQAHAKLLYSADEDTDNYLLTSSTTRLHADSIDNTVNGDEEEDEQLRVLPTQKEIEEMILKRKKEMLLEKYASEALVSQEGTTTAMLGKSK